jgi:hypothetical protein
MPTAPAATNAADPPEEPPGVIRLGEAADRELRKRRLGHEDHAGRAHRRDQVGVVTGGPRGAAAAVTRDLTSHVELVLDGDRDAQQRSGLARAPATVGLVGRRERLLPEDRDDRVDPRVLPLDRSERRLGQLTRGQGPGGEQLALAGGSGGNGLGSIHAQNVPCKQSRHQES